MAMARFMQSGCVLASGVGLLVCAVTIRLHGADRVHRLKARVAVTITDWAERRSGALTIESGHRYARIQRRPLVAVQHWLAQMYTGLITLDSRAASLTRQLAGRGHPPGAEAAKQSGTPVPAAPAMRCQ
jgi:hypothetical protein